MVIRNYFDPLLLGLPSRALTALAKNDVTRIEELAGLSPMDLNSLDGVGPATVDQIREHLRTFDLTLETDLPEVPLYEEGRKELLDYVSGYTYGANRWWQREAVDVFCKATPTTGWINRSAFSCTMEFGPRTISVSADHEKRQLDCSCGGAYCYKHGLAGFLLMVKAERMEELFGESPLEEQEDEPVYQPLSHDPLFYLLDSTVRTRLLKQDLRWTEELAAQNLSELKEIDGIGRSRLQDLKAFLRELNLRPGVPPASVDLSPGERFPPDFGQFLLRLRRNGLNPDRGVRYFQLGKVDQLNRRSDRVYTARVHGRRTYEVDLNMADERHSCSCPVENRRGPCKHIFATALTVAKRKRMRVLSGSDRRLGDDLIWLKQYLSSNQDDDDTMISTERRQRSELNYYLYTSRGQWHVYPTDEGPAQMEGVLADGPIMDSSPFEVTRGMTPKDAVLVRHLESNYFGVRPSNREGLLGEILPMMSDRPVFVQEPDGSFTEAEVMDDRVEPGLELTGTSGEELRLSPYVQQGDERYGADRFDLICPNPMWVRVGHRLFRSSSHHSLFVDLLDRLDEGVLEVSGDERSAFVEEMLPDMIERELPMHVETSAADEKEVEPVPRVYLTEVGDHLRIELRYAYGEIEFTRISDGQFPMPAEEGSGLVSVERRPEQERRWREQLLESGVEAASERTENEFAPVDRLPWLIEVLPELPEQGFEVYGEEDLDDRPEVVDAVNSRASISSGIDWFEVSGEVEFEEGRASFSDIMEEVEEGSSYIQLSDGTHGRIPEKWIRRLADLNDVADAGDDAFQVPGLTIQELDELVEEVDEAETGETVERYRRFYREFEGIDSATETDRFQGTLRDYQRAGLAWMQFLREYGFGGLLADDMGLGKTVQVLAHLQAVREQLGHMPDTLVVAPRSVLRNWQKEARRFLPDPPVYQHHGTDRRGCDDWPEHRLSFTTYGTMRSDIDGLKEREFDTVVLDECQAIRNPDTKQAKASRLLTANHRLGLSGTPVQNTVMDLWSQFQFLNPGLLGGRSYFESRFAEPIESDRNQERSDRLQRLIHPFLLRRTKEQVEQDLPELSRTVIDCPMPDLQADVYESFRKHFHDVVSESMEENGVQQSRFKVLEGLTRLRQICCHPTLVDENGDLPDVSSKLDEFVDSAGEVIDEGHRALVFSQFVTFLDKIKQAVEREGWTYEYLDGSTRNREERVQRFQSDESISLFLISLKAGGEGLNLTGADYVFLMDPWWNPAVERQAMDRTHRIGQDQPVMVYRLICPGTIEEDMLSLQERKKDVAEDIVTPDADFFKDMDRDDLLDLFS